MVGPCNSSRLLDLGTRKSQKKQGNVVVKYCSDRCRNRKPGPLDRKIEQTIVSLLNGDPESGLDKTDAKSRTVKGDHRVVVTCDEIEEIVFGSRFDPEKVFGRRKNRASRVIGKNDSEWKSVDMEDSTEGSADEIEHYDDAQHFLGPRVRPPQTKSDVNGSIGGERGWAEKIEESPEDLEKRREGQRRAEEREMVRRAARRAVVFGFLTDDPSPSADSKSKKGRARASEGGVAITSTEPIRRKCEALMNGSVVEPSFAKGDWSIRWREN